MDANAFNPTESAVLRQGLKDFLDRQIEIVEEIRAKDVAPADMSESQKFAICYIAGAPFKSKILLVDNERTNARSFQIQCELSCKTGIVRSGKGEYRVVSFQSQPNGSP
jgi:hypothetical protein